MEKNITTRKTLVCKCCGFEPNEVNPCVCDESSRGHDWAEVELKEEN